MMLYYIIPPVVMVVSLAALVLFLSKKTEVINREIMLGQSEDEARKQLVVSKINRVSLSILEKNIYRVKLIFLKSYNMFDAWVHSIRKQREHHAAQIAAIEREQQERPEQILENKAEIILPEEPVEVFSRPTRIVTEPVVEIPVTKMTGAELVAEVTQKPVIVRHDAAKKMQRPERPMLTKSKLEEALIERIAENPRDLEAYERLGEHYIERQNLPDALECFKQVLKLAPGNRKAKAQVKKLEKNVLGW
ncbi:tetratricopeptide repeat protein [Patescibacteria group bacterium]|nr:MAG: tetratricopeptide repeat protein [Patescibacteria group bacterium]